MGQAEGYTAFREIGGGGPGVHESGLRGLLHPFEIEFHRFHPTGHKGNERHNGFSGFEERLLGFLQVFVVGKRQAFHRDHQ